MLMNWPIAAVAVFRLVFAFVCEMSVVVSGHLFQYDTHTNSSTFFLSFLSFFWFTFCLSSSTLYHLSMRVLVMSIDSNFVFEFIA